MTTALILVAVACAAMLALFACLLVPFRVGGHLVPIAILLAVLTTAGIPQALIGARVPVLGAAAPLAAWLVVVTAMSYAKPEGDVVLPGNGGEGAISYAVMGGGALAGIVSLGWRALRPSSG
jgi:hypothetical protein